MSGADKNGKHIMIIEDGAKRMINFLVKLDTITKKAVSKIRTVNKAKNKKKGKK